jgi:hypothetical protein
MSGQIFKRGQKKELFDLVEPSANQDAALLEKKLSDLVAIWGAPRKK